MVAMLIIESSFFSLYIQQSILIAVKGFSMQLRRTLGVISALCLFSSAYAAEPITPLPESVSVDKAKAQLGEQLYNDKGLSPNKTVSCASCHDLKKGGTDNLKVSTGINGQQGPINSPTVLNSRYNIKQFWDGRAEDLAHQAEGPVTNPKEMGSNWPYVVNYLKSKPDYLNQFKASYDGKIDKATITNAIATYEETLVTPSPFDDYLRGDKNAISEQAKKGYALFKSYGCTACHQGINIGGGMFMKVGMVSDYFKRRGGKLTEADYGRYNVTKQEADKHVFKVPTLRNVSLTAPYFHDGSEASLQKAVITMAKVQLGRDMPEDDAKQIVAFLESLTGKELKK